MPRSADLRQEAAAMARIESAYEAAKNLPEKAAKRVLQWAKDEFHPESPDENGQGTDG